MEGVSAQASVSVNEDHMCAEGGNVLLYNNPELGPFSGVEREEVLLVGFVEIDVVVVYISNEPVHHEALEWSFGSRAETTDRVLVRIVAHNQRKADLPACELPG